MRVGKNGYIWCTCTREIRLKRQMPSHVTCNLNESRERAERKKQGCLKRREWRSSTFQRRCNTILASVCFAFGERLLAKCSRAAALDRRKRPFFVFLLWTNKSAPSAILIAKETSKNLRRQCEIRTTCEF